MGVLHLLRARVSWGRESQTWEGRVEELCVESARHADRQTSGCLDGQDLQARAAA